MPVLVQRGIDRMALPFLAANELDEVVPGHARHPPRLALAAVTEPGTLRPPGRKTGLIRKSTTDYSLDLGDRKQEAPLVRRSLGEVLSEPAPLVSGETMVGPPSGGLRGLRGVLTYGDAAVGIQISSLPTPLLRSCYISQGAWLTPWIYLPLSHRSYHIGG
jgi:hypothetical protein